MGIASAFEDLSRAVWRTLRKPAESFLLPQAAVDVGDVGVLVCPDGSLATVLSVAGARSLTGAEEVERFVETAARRLTTSFAGPGHALHVAFERAPEDAGDLLAAEAERSGRACARIGLDLRDLLEERVRRLAPLAAAETVAVACWTRPSALTPDRRRLDGRAVAARLRHWEPPPDGSQCPFRAETSLGPLHAAFVAEILALLAETDIAASACGAAGTVRRLRAAFCGPDSAGPEWRPATAAGEAPARDTDPPSLGAYPPPLAPQILVREPVRGPAGAVTVGARTWRALDMELGPRQGRPFGELVARLAGTGQPFRASILIEGGGLRAGPARTAQAAAAFLAFSSPDSAAVRDASRELAALADAGQAVVRLRIGFLTWTPAGAAPEVLAHRISRLQQAVEGWGEITATPVVGDTLEALCASVPGFCCGSTAVPNLAPLPEALRLLPFGRPAPLTRSPPAHMFRSPDGRLLPYAFDGDYGCDLIHGVPGRGKSVLMNTLGLAFATQPGQRRLPLNAVVDIGPSSHGLISLLREALPPERRREAVWVRWRMEEAHAVNPMDTPLGCRTPTPTERGFLRSLLGLMVTPAGAEGIPDGMRELLGPTISAAYALRSDASATGEPHRYTAGRDPAVDAAVARHGARLPDRAVWWEVVDALFEAGASAAAIRAQRYAVPVLVDLLSAVRTPTVQGLVGEAVHAGSESVTSAFTRIMADLSAAWPTMFRPTRFDLGNARVAAIDLSAVAPAGSPEADRQTAAFYLLARHAMTRDWWTDPDALDAVPERYRPWHRDRARRMAEAPKRICYDEFHRTGAAPAVRAQIERDVREGRKLRVRIALSSQRPRDFGPVLTELASTFWILGAGGRTSEIEELDAVFGLGPTLRDAARFDLTGPTATGSPALVIASGADGRTGQLVVNSPGAHELWALTTAPVDVALRDRLYRRLGPAAARAALAAAFPEGTARARVARELADLEARGAHAAASEEEVLDRLAAGLAAAATGGEGRMPWTAAKTSAA